MYRHTTLSVCKTMGLGGLAASALFAGQAFAMHCPAGTLGSPICIATDGGGAEPSLQEALDGLTISGPGIDVYNDQDQPSAYWTIGATGGSENTVVLELSANDNDFSFGIFDRNDPMNVLELFSGNAVPGWNTKLSDQAGGLFVATYFDAAGGLVGSQDTATFASGDVFGYYLGTPAVTFYSDASLNAAGGASYPDGTPQMVAYEGDGATTLNIGGNIGTFLVGETLLAWEDLPFASSDLDYQDFLVLVESVQPVPEPAVLGMFALGTLLIGAAAGLKRR